jgi:methionyl-tRNA formyltransferase
VVIKLLLFLSTKKGYEVLETMCKLEFHIIGMVVIFQEKNVQEKYNEKIEQLCLQKKINCRLWGFVKNDLCNIILNNNISYAIAIGWKYLIPFSINEVLKDGLIVFHDSILPKYRGFSPTPTAIICGEEEIGMSVIYASEKVDAGNIILQKKVTISQDMYIAEIIDIQSHLYVQAILDLIMMIKHNKIVSITQDETMATYSIWRNPEDCKIDWSRTSKQIYNLIRAVSFPYTGAFAYTEHKKNFIWKAEVVGDIKFAIRDCGKIWSFDKNNKPIVTCGNGMLKLLEVTDEQGSEISFSRLRARFI